MFAHFKDILSQNVLFSMSPIRYHVSKRKTAARLNQNQTIDLCKSAVPIVRKGLVPIALCEGSSAYCARGLVPIVREA